MYITRVEIILMGCQPLSWSWLNLIAYTLYYTILYTELNLVLFVDLSSMLFCCFILQRSRRTCSKIKGISSEIIYPVQCRYIVYVYIYILYFRKKT